MRCPGCGALDRAPRGVVGHTRYHLVSLRPSALRVIPPIASSPGTAHFSRSLGRSDQSRTSSRWSFAPRVGVEPTSLILIQSQAGPAGRPTGESTTSTLSAQARLGILDSDRHQRQVDDFMTVATEEMTWSRFFEFKAATHNRPESKP